jgi:hypothetical protein
MNIANMKKSEIVERSNWRCVHSHNGLEHPSCWDQNKGLDKKIGFVDIECVLPGTLILTKNGLKSIENIKIGEKVLTHKNRWEKVIKTYKNKYTGNIYNISPTQNLSILSTTPNHPFLCSGYKEKHLEKKQERHDLQHLKSQWLNAENITQRNLLFGIINNEAWLDIKEVEIGEQSKADRHNTSNIPNKLTIDEDFLTVIGLFLGDGYAHNFGIEINPNIKDKEFIKIIKRWAFKIGANNLSLKKEGKIFRVVICSSRLGKFFSQFYNENKEKYLPLKWLNIPNERFMFILKGLFLSDGNMRIYKNRTDYNITNTSEKLLNDISIRLQFTTYHPTLIKIRDEGETSFPNGKIYKTKKAYVLRYQLDNKKYRANSSIRLVDYSIKKIKQLFKTKYDGYVYNLHVENDESYIANGIVTHNTSNLKATYGIVFSYCIKEHSGQIISNSVTPKELKDGSYDKRLMQDFYSDAKKFDKLIGYYSSRFDIPFLRSRAVFHNLKFPLYQEIKHTDLYLIIKHRFNLHSKRLGVVCEFFHIPSKDHKMNSHVWFRAMQGDQKALDYIVVHCKEDVISTELLWNKVCDYSRITDTSI